MLSTRGVLGARSHPTWCWDDQTALPTTVNVTPERPYGTTATNSFESDYHLIRWNHTISVEQPCSVIRSRALSSMKVSVAVTGSGRISSTGTALQPHSR